VFYFKVNQILLPVMVQNSSILLSVGFELIFVAYANDSEVWNVEITHRILTKMNNLHKIYFLWNFYFAKHEKLSRIFLVQGFGSKNYQSTDFRKSF
jgi:hypothetical protein